MERDSVSPMTVDREEEEEAAAAHKGEVTSRLAACWTLELQSCFDKSDKRFSSSQSLRSSSVATDWGGNERVVNAVKRAWFLKRGFQNNLSEKQMNDAWMTWSNQCNFMYDHNNLTLSNSVL